MYERQKREFLAILILKRAAVGSGQLLVAKAYLHTLYFPL